METSKEPQGKSKSPRKPGRETDVKAADPKLCNPLPLDQAWDEFRGGWSTGLGKNHAETIWGFRNWEYPLVNQHNYGKSPFLKGKSTISTGPFSIANCLFTRGYPQNGWFIRFILEIPLFFS